MSAQNTIGNKHIYEYPRKRGILGITICPLRCVKLLLLCITYKRIIRYLL